MSVSKYADLPDIDTAPDVYETADTFPLSQTVNNVDSSDDESTFPTRSARNKPDPNGREELDYSNLIGADEASRKFRKAEKKASRVRTQYAYPPSPTSPTSILDPFGISHSLPLSHRLRMLQNELAALETELADPSNPLIHKEREEENIDPGELIRGLVDVRSRLDKIKKGKEGRARLIGVVLDDNILNGQATTGKATGNQEQYVSDPKTEPKTDMQTMVEMDRRIGELEHIIGSSGMTLDETSPLPSPLLPLITRLNNQLTILTQPRHIDSISRRLKLLLSDLDRASAVQHQAHKRHPSQSNNGSSPPTVVHEILPILTRLGPLLPHIPHVLTRLRTLSSLHSSAATFQSSLEDLEEEQKRTRNGLLDLERAIETVETSLKENKDVVKSNVAGLEGRVNSLLDRLEDLIREQISP